jgi:FkbM family methyltransferase
MKFEEKIKQRYLYRPGFNLIKNLYFCIQALKSKNLKKSYSGGAQDLIINYFFKNKKKGIYIDVGCYHPYNGNNTKLLYDKGWSGINIDLDFHTINFFNFVRKRDENINIAISDKEGVKDLYFFHNRSAINSLSEIRKEEAKEVRKIQTKTLNSVFENSKFKNEKINLLSIDVEGHEIEVLKSLDLAKYIPEMVVIEFLERDIINNLEFHNQNINEVLNSEIYRHMIKNNYHFVNWLHSDLIFVHNSARN